MEVSTAEVKQYFNDLKKEILDQQTRWEQLDPRPHAVGVFARRNRLEWYKEILPKIDGAIVAVENIEEKESYIE